MPCGCLGLFTWSDFHEPIVLYKYGIAREVAMDDGWWARMQVTGKRNDQIGFTALEVKLSELIISRSFCFIHGEELMGRGRNGVGKGRFRSCSADASFVLLEQFTSELNGSTRHRIRYLDSVFIYLSQHPPQPALYNNTLIIHSRLSSTSST